MHLIFSEKNGDCTFNFGDGVFITIPCVNDYTSDYTSDNTSDCSFETWIDHITKGYGDFIYSVPCCIGSSFVIEVNKPDHVTFSIYNDIHLMNREVMMYKKVKPLTEITLHKDQCIEALRDFHRFVYNVI